MSVQVGRLVFGLTSINERKTRGPAFILIGQSQSQEEAVSTRKSRRVGNDVRFRDGDSTISTAISRAEARLDRARTEAQSFTQAMR
jgi:hypothetical protein